jgi:Uma2 family endonuclease
MPTTTLEPPVVSADTPVHRFTVRQYDRMTQDGAFDDAKVELLDGVIYDKMPHNAPHDHAVSQLQLALILMFQGAMVVRTQSSVTFPTSVPEPDIAILPGPASLYAEIRPDFRDLAVVIEVADTTLARDRGLKMKLYARAKVPVYWIVNLVDGVVEVYTDPRGGKTPAYRIRTDYKPGEAVPVAIGKKVVGSVPVSNLLP